MQLHNHIRRAIDSIRQGTIGPALLDIFLPLGIPVPKECALWDYKASFEAHKVAYAELAKDILSFFNSYGGYLFLGVSEFAKDEHFAVVGFQRPPNVLASLRGAIDSYSSVQIDIAIADLRISDQNVTAIFIPCRPNSQARISDALRVLRSVREHPDLPSSAHGAYDDAITLLEKTKESKHQITAQKW